MRGAECLLHAFFSWMRIWCREGGWKMTACKNTSGRALPVFLSVLMGTTGAIIFTLFFCAVLAKLIDGELVKQTAIVYTVPGILMAASFLGAQITCGRIGRNYLMCCLLSGFAYALSLLGITALFFDGAYHAVGATLPAALSGSVLRLLLAGRGERKKKRRKMR